MTEITQEFVLQLIWGYIIAMALLALYLDVFDKYGDHYYKDSRIYQWLRRKLARR